MVTAARTFSEGNCHWYAPDGTPVYQLPKKDGKGMKAPTLTDARKLGLLPSVTKIIGILDKPALNDWKVEQACLAIITSVQKPGEELDAFVHRILHEERVQEEQAKAARDLGSRIHDAIDSAISGREWDRTLDDYVKPVVKWVMETGKVVWTEKHLVGDGYGGRGDALLYNEALGTLILPDFKTTSSLPDKDSWLEHRLQTAAYAATLVKDVDRKILTGNVYISTKNPGEIKVCTQDDWATTYVNGFCNLLKFWQWNNSYWPGNAEKV